MEGLESLVIHAQAGDREAFGMLVQRYQHMAVGYAYSLIGDFGLAEDAAQEAFVQAYLDLNKLREPRAFPAWFRRLVFKYCDRMFRGRRVWMTPLDEAPQLASDDSCPLKSAKRREISAKVMRAIALLPDHERVVTTLFYIDGYSQAEIGEFLDVPVSTIKSRLYLARKKLQTRIPAMLKETLQQHAPGQDFTRKVEEILDGVEHIEWKKGCNCFCGSVVACMTYLNEKVNYDFVAGISGVAFHIQWQSGWAYDNCDPLAVGYDPVEHAFRALGYDYTLIPHDFKKTAPESRKEVWQQQIVDSINRGCPVIAFGVVGPPESCVIAGYAQEGEVLLGRSYFHQDSKGYFRQADWYGNCYGMILIGAKTDAPPRRAIIRASLEQAVELARTRERNGRTTGLAVYPVWADALERDEEFAVDDLEAITLRCIACIDDGLGYQADARQTVSRFLTSIAEESGAAAADIRMAAQIYQEESALLREGWKLGPSHLAPESERRRILDRTHRLQLAQIVRQAGEKEREAVAHLEHALHNIS